MRSPRSSAIPTKPAAPSATPTGCTSMRDGICWGRGRPTADRDQRRRRTLLDRAGRASRCSIPRRTRLGSTGAPTTASTGSPRRPGCRTRRSGLRSRCRVPARAPRGVHLTRGSAWLSHARSTCGLGLRVWSGRFAESGASEAYELRTGARGLPYRAGHRSVSAPDSLAPCARCLAPLMGGLCRGRSRRPPQASSWYRGSASRCPPGSSSRRPLRLCELEHAAELRTCCRSGVHASAGPTPTGL
jgi:hypothetical protein